MRRSATSEIRSTFGGRAQLIGLPRAAASVSPRCRGLTSIGLGLRRPSSALASERLGQSPEHEAKNGVSPRCLHERLAVLEKRWHASCAPLRVEAVDEVAKREERRMLAQGQPNTERMRPRRPSTTRLVVCQPEQSTVREVHREARRPPRATIGHRLPEHRDIRVVTADQPTVKRLLKDPHHSRSSG